jgi:hypothetical protein
MISSKKFFALRGHQKSGTNWVSNILNLHPKILIRGEYHFHRIKKYGIDNFLTLDFDKKYINAIDKDFEKIVKKFVFSEKDVNKKNILLFGDRTSGPGADLMPLFSSGYSQIFIIRDGRDILTSLIYHQMRVLSEIGIDNVSPWPELVEIFKKFPFLKEKSKQLKNDQYYFEKNPDKLFNEEGYVKFLSKIWSDYVKENIEIIKRAKKGLIKTKIHCVKYEDLHKNIEGTRREIYKFLELSPEAAAPLNECTKPGFKKTNNLKFYRKGVVGNWRNYFDSNVCRCFKKGAGDILIELGYEKNNGWDNKL